VIIVSQDKETIVNFDNIAHIFIEKGSETTIGYGKMSGCTETLGHYETEERAKEVLQEIVAKYLDYVKTGGRFDYKALNNTTEHYYSLPKVYEMPEE